VYAWTERTLVQHQYASLSRLEKGLVRRYVSRMYWESELFGHEKGAFRATDRAGQYAVDFLSATAFMQYRNPPGAGPSGKTWPRWASQLLQMVSTRLRKAGPSKR
jgi:hypothetical protein